MFRVRCPICGGQLTVDARSRKVTDHMTRAEAERSADEQFESILDNVQKSKATQEARLDAAKKREAKRKKHVEELSKKAQEQASESDQTRPPPGPVWD